MSQKVALKEEPLSCKGLRARWRFKAIVRQVIANVHWLGEVGDDEFLGENVKRNVQLLTKKKKEAPSLLKLMHKAILNKPAADRTVADKQILNRVIGNLKCFRKYPPDLAMELVGFTYFAYYGPGRVIVRQNHVAHALYFIVSGEVNVLVSYVDPVLNETVSTKVGSLAAGAIFGEVSLMQNIPRTATIVTTTPCEMLTLNRSDFDIVLKSTVKEQWDDILDSMKLFTYFDKWSDLDRRDCCLICKKQTFAIGETVFGENAGAHSYAHFILRGRIRVIESLQVVVQDDDGEKRYSLYTSSRHVTEMASLRIKDTKPHFVGLQDFQGSMSNLSDKRLEHHLSRRSSTRSWCSFQNVQTHFMQVCILSEKACFNIGEKMRRRSLVAIDEVECLLIPKYYLLHQNKDNLWTRITRFLDKQIPSTQQVFKGFVEGRKWHRFKKKMIADRVSNTPAANIINNVPYSIRMNEDLDFADMRYELR